MSSKNNLFIGVCGGSASGKTTICKELVDIHGEAAQIISQDSYYIDRSHLTDDEVKKVNFDHPDSINVEKLHTDIIALKENNSTSIPQYCFKTHSVLKDKVDIKIKQINIVEGLYVLSSENLRNLFDIKIYIHADDDVRLVRRIKRDLEHRGRDLPSILDQYLATVKPMNDKYVVQQKKFADIVVDASRPDSYTEIIESLLLKIKRLSQ